MSTSSNPSLFTSATSRYRRAAGVPGGEKMSNTGSGLAAVWFGPGKGAKPRSLPSTANQARRQVTARSAFPRPSKLPAARSTGLSSQAGWSEPTWSGRRRRGRRCARWRDRCMRRRALVRRRPSGPRSPLRRAGSRRRRARSRSAPCRSRSSTETCAEGAATVPAPMLATTRSRSPSPSRSPASMRAGASRTVSVSPRTRPLGPPSRMDTSSSPLSPGGPAARHREVVTPVAVEVPRHQRARPHAHGARPGTGARTRRPGCPCPTRPRPPPGRVRTPPPDPACRRRRSRRRHRAGPARDVERGRRIEARADRRRDAAKLAIRQPASTIDVIPRARLRALKPIPAPFHGVVGGMSANSAERYSCLARQARKAFRSSSRRPATRPRPRRGR